MNYTELASKEVLAKVSAALIANNFMPEVVATKEAALARIKELIPQGASVMNGTSTTLEEIGYIDYLKAGQHGWINLHEKIINEKDQAKQSMLRKSTVPDFYLGSVHAVTENGELVIASASGSQLPFLAFTAANLVLIVSTQKVVPTLTDALGRIDTQIVPLEDARMKTVYGPNSGTVHAKTLILHKEGKAMGRKAHVVFVEEKLGF